MLTIDCANVTSCYLAEKCGFDLFEKQTPMGHRQYNMVTSIIENIDAENINRLCKFYITKVILREVMNFP